MPAPLFVVVGQVPGLDADPGQVVDPGRAKDKHLALKNIKPLVRGASLLVCDCGAKFAGPDHLAAHQAKRHPAPPVTLAKQPPVDTPPAAPESPAPATQEETQDAS